MSATLPTPQHIDPARISELMDRERALLHERTAKSGEYFQRASAVMTGAVMPAGCDTVVPQELAQADGDRVRIEAGVIRPGENRRRRGEDLAAGKPALRAGRVLRPADIGLVASLGLAGVSVKRRLRVALFSTGDEL